MVLGWVPWFFFAAQEAVSSSIELRSVRRSSSTGITSDSVRDMQTVIF